MLKIWALNTCDTLTKNLQKQKMCMGMKITKFRISTTFKSVSYAGKEKSP